MGNRQSILEQINIYEAPLNELIYKQPGNKFKIYQHYLKKYEVMAHRLKHSERQLTTIYENFKARYQHQYLVSSLFLNIEDNSTCGGFYQTVVYYQRIFTNLTKIKDIPFNDVLHFYAVSFKGFHILFKRFGYFQIYQDMFHLGQDSKLKVWCNKDISKNQPEIYLIDSTGTQEDMIRKIMFIIDQNSDHQSEKINIKNLLNSYGIKNFQMANQSLRQICRKYDLSISERVNCLKSLPSQQVEAMLDLYTSNLYKEKNVITNNQNIEMTFNPIQNKKIIENQKIHQTPQFIKPQTYQNKKIPKLQFAQHPSESNLGFSNMSILKNQAKMLQTFNVKPQLPLIRKIKGLDLSLHKKDNSIRNKDQIIGEKIARNYSGHIMNVSPILFSQPRIINSPTSSIKVQFNNKSPIYPIKNNTVNIQTSFYPPIVNNINIPSNINNVEKKYIYSPNNPENRLNYHLNLNQKPVSGLNGKNISFHHNQPAQPSKSLQNDQKYLNASRSNHNLSGSSILIQNIKNHNYQFIDPQINKRPTSAVIHNRIQPNQINQINQDNLVRSIKNLNQINNYNKNNNNNNNKSSKILKQDQNPNIYQHNSIFKTFNPNNYKQIKRQQRQIQKSYKQVQNIQKKYQVNKNYNYLKVPNNQYISIKKQIQKKPLDFKFNNQYNLNGLRSSSSRYVSSNKQINNNIPQLNQKKKSQFKSIQNIFDPKIIQLQSYVQSHDGASLKNLHLLQQNSRVLEIIGRQKKDSITSAFANDQLSSRNDQIKQYSKKQNSSFTDPKILQILKKPVTSQSTKILINELTNLKKASNAGKKFDSNNNFGYKKIQISKQNNQDKFNIQNNQYKYHDASKNLILFPSLSNLSQINKIQEQNSFYQDNQKVNSTINMNKNLSLKMKKSRFSQQKNNLIVQGNNNNYKDNINEIIQYDYKNIKNDFSFLTKKQQIPNKDIQGINEREYGISNSKYKSNNIQKGQITKNNKTREIYSNNIDNSYNFYKLGSQNSNQSLASLQWQLNKKKILLKAHMNDRIQEVNESSQTLENSSSIKLEEVSSNRKYNPKIDPEINKDLQRLRQLRKTTKVK